MAIRTREIARAMALDAGDRHRRANGRVNQPWTQADWTAACDEYDRLLLALAAEENQPEGVRPNG